MKNESTDGTMSEAGIVYGRLLNQRITRKTERDPVEVVRWHGAIQAQDFGGAKWAVGLRVRDATDAAIGDAFNEGRILRTHVLRPTWHFVTPEDIRWMLDLTAPRIKTAISSYYRRFGFDDAVFRHSQKVLERELRDRVHVSRSDLVDALKRDRIALDNLGYLQLLLRAELDGLICSGPRIGKQFTYALLDQRVPRMRTLERDQALAELSLRYFTSHGPATIKDFSWWSGLTLRDARLGLNLVAGTLEREVINGTEYWFSHNELRSIPQQCSVHLLPNYDELVVGYSNRSVYWQEPHHEGLVARSNPLFSNMVIVDGRFAGTWARKVRKRAVEVSVNLFTRIGNAAAEALEESLERYGHFLQLPLLRA